MALSTFPAVASPVKSVQRGSAGGAGSVTITSVDIAKSFVNIFGTASSGTVAASFGLNAPGAGNTSIIGVSIPGSPNVTGTSSGIFPTGATKANSAQTYAANNNGNFDTWSIASAVNAGTAPTPNAGSNNLVAAVVQGFLANATTLTVSGACRFEVVEFN